MRALLHFISGLYLIYLFYLFMVWYIKGHFRKYFIFFWAFTIFMTWYYFDQQKKMQIRYNSDTKSGSEIWAEKMKNYDPVRGY